MKKLIVIKNIGLLTRGFRGYFLVREILDRKDLKIQFVCQTKGITYHFLKNIVCNKNIPYFKIENNINSLDNINLIKSFNCDLLISCGYDQIFKKELIDLKIINCHSSELPKYRGRNVLKRALFNNEKYFGITVHWVDEGIDTGSIIIQKLYPIVKRNYRTLLNIVRKQSVYIILEAIDKLNEKVNS